MVREAVAVCRGVHCPVHGGARPQARPRLASIEKVVYPAGPGRPGRPAVRGVAPRVVPTILSLGWTLKQLGLCIAEVQTVTLKKVDLQQSGG